MTHFAEIDSNGIVLRVIVAEQDFIDSGKMGEPKNWVQTSYNTRFGINTRTGIAIRKNYAGVGYKYDKVLDAFIPPKQYPSFILNETKGIYENPVPMPKDGKIYGWNENTLSWVY
jgi:hypothetical protein